MWHQGCEVASPGTMFNDHGIIECYNHLPCYGVPGLEGTKTLSM